LIDLGALPEENPASAPNDINGNGVVTGISFNGGVDSVFGLPYFDGVVWKDGQIIDLGTFGGPLSYANEINDQGQVAGFALNATPDSFDLGDFCQNFPMPTQMHAFIWQDGVLQDLGTLGGTDSCALFINQRGQATGNSFTNSIVNPTTGLPTLHPFLWTGDKMVDLKTLGGTMAVANGINNRGQVAGASTMNGDQVVHAFIWDESKLKDLGNLGGNSLEVIGFSETGEMVGKADLPGSQIHHAFLAREHRMSDLGTQDGDPCSVGVGINARGQVVGGSTDCSNFLHAFLWERGHMIDLNSFLPAGSGLTLTQADFINDRGEIAVQAVLPNCETHAVLLVPCDEEPGDREGCEPEGGSSGALRHALQSPRGSVVTRHLPAWQRMSTFASRRPTQATEISDPGEHGGAR
jgi:probable HAF family extracellular repeat protein